MARQPAVDHIRIFLDKNNKYRASIVFTNNEIWATTEAYSSKIKCLNSVNVVNKNVKLPVIMLDQGNYLPTTKIKKNVKKETKVDNA